MASVNKVILIGNLCADPELRDTKSGSKVCNVRMATNRVWTNKDGEKQEEAEFHRVTIFGKHGENVAKYMSKGRQLYVEGRLHTSDYEKDGQKHYSTEVVADVTQFLGGGSGERTGERTDGSSITYTSSKPDDDVPF